MTLENGSRESDPEAMPAGDVGSFGSLRMSVGALFFFAALMGVGACHRPLDKIVSLREAWATGDRERAAHVVELAECPPPPAALSAPLCLDGAAKAFGSPKFSSDRPDQASAAAVAFVLAVRGSGETIPATNTWLEAMANATGAGADALRLAVASRLAEGAPSVGKPIEDEAAARKMMGAVASAVPGACETYGAIGRGAEISSFAPAESPDHAPCVQHDLERKGGPGAAYGDGLWRAAAGAAALWRDAAQALALGMTAADGSVRATLRAKLDVIEAATRGMSLKTIATTQTGQYQATDAHRAERALPDAGAPMGKRP